MGAIIAYPVNVWLVAVGLKHGMGSVRVLGAGGHRLEAEAERIRTTSGEEATSLMAAKPGRATPAAKDALEVQAPADSAKMSMKGGTTLPQLTAVTVLTLLALGAGIVLAGLSGGLGMVPTQMESMPVSP